MTALISSLGWALISAIGKTLRVRDINALPDWTKKPYESVVFAFWHGEQFVACYRHRGQGVVIMSSMSRDGEIQTGILQRCGYRVVRGSSTRGGEKALVESIRLVRKGASAAFAVDGPKGPYHKIKPGIIYLAQKTGRPVVPVSTASRRCRVFAKAWDRYELPLPFTKSVIMYGTPVPVKPDDDVAAKSLEIEREMEKLTAFTHGYAFSRDIAAYLDHHPKPKILIVQPSRIGDVLFTLPAAADLRKRFPHAWIGWFVDERCAPLLNGCPDIDEVIVFDRRKRSPSYIKGLYDQLHARNIDLSIDFHGLFKSAFMVMLAGAHFKLASSSTNGMREFSWLFSKEIPPSSPETHCVERHRTVARYLGAAAGEPEYHVGISDADARRVAALLVEKGLSSGKPVIGVHPGGGWLSRRWGGGKFADLITKLAREKNCQVVLVGGKEGGASERGLNEEIREKADVPLIDLTGMLSLGELAAFLKSCDVFVANEAGPMHLATALSVPAVALLGPTDAKRTGPYGGRTIVIQKKVDCQPCRNRSCAERTCMNRIEVDEVFAAVCSQIKER